MRRVAAALVALVLLGCSDDTEPEVLLDLGDRAPGEVVALRADGEAIEWLDRTAGQVLRLEPGAEPTIVASVDVGTEGEQRGLLGQTVLDGRRFAAWTEPDDLRLVVGELLDAGAPRIVWSGTTTETRAVGGHLRSLDGRLLLGLGELTGWAQEHGSGALVTLDPDGPPEQDPAVVSDGWNNPFAFVVADDGTILVADNTSVGGRERLAAIADDDVATELPAPERAPSAIAVLDDGRIAVCGFLDGELRAYEVGDDGFERAGTPGGCRSAVTVTASGRTVVATSDALLALD
ncbi:MAG: hypothetical protein AAFZ07_27665 [Actinomycetota bacterium]